MIIPEMSQRTVPTAQMPSLAGIGIDIGTTFFGACVYAIGAGFGPPEPIPVPGQLRESKFPSIVFIPTDSRQPELVGEAALNADVQGIPGKIFSRFKLALGTDWHEEHNGRRISARSLTTTLLKEIKNGIDIYLHDRTLSHIPKRYCFSYPGMWNEKTLKDFREAITDAGFPPFSVIPEPVATALAVARFGNHPEIARKDRGQPQNTLVCDFGGGTFDIALVDVADGGWIHTRYASDGNPYLGMSNLDLILGMLFLQAQGRLNRHGNELLEHHIVEEPHLGKVWAEQGLKREWNFGLERVCAELKKTISGGWNRNGPFVTALPDGNPGVIAKDTLVPFIEAMHASATATVIRFIKELDAHHIQASEIASIAIGGGGSKLPGIHEAIGAILPHARILDINLGIVTDLVQYGAAVAAADPGTIRELRLNSSYGIKIYLDNVPHWHAQDVRIGHKPDIETVQYPGGSRPHYAHYRKILHKGEILSEEKRISFPVLHPNRPSIVFQVLQGEAENPRENTFLGNVECPLNTGVAAGYEVECVFRVIKESGLLEVTAFDPKTGRGSLPLAITPDLG
jgi:molecular chaperone DnaK (HSP70)